MARRKHKKILARTGADVAAGKIPRISPGFDTGDSQTPTWLVSHVDTAGPFGWHALDKGPFLDQVLPKLQQYESMTWGQILGRNSHAVAVRSLCKEAQKRLQEQKLVDIEELVSLRLTGIQRVWGIRRQREFRLLWWDPYHQVCPSRKKNT